MLVRDLIRNLEEHKDKEILFSSDEEGNNIMDKCYLSKEGQTIILLPFNYVEE